MSKKVLGGVAAASMVLSLAACGGGGAAAEDTLTVVMWGGGAQKAHVDSYVTPWAEETGVTIRQDSPTDYAKISAQVDSGKVSWGLVEVEPNYGKSACDDGKLEKLPQRVLDAAEKADIDPAQMNDCAIPILQYTFSIAYNTDTFGDAHPTTWAEFFDTEQFPGKRGFWKYVTGGAFEAALLADGVAPEDLYPLDLDRAFRKLETIKDDIVWYDTGDQQVQLVSSGEAPLIQAWNGRISQAAADGESVANEYGQNLVSYDQIVVPKGYANADLAFDWMVWFLENTQAQADDVVASGYGPASPQAVELVPADIRDDIAGSPAVDDKSASVIDYDYWAENYDEVTQRFNTWITE
ncbi:ABC transporter substrate-binding protein [Aeromicrobium phragmitis]|uniref:ABC transporter substrate-binding protein n=1 Tax=Aeromicrobium phragmitis TaxID=2478914 RepID=A0A3L8PTR9_9ACTN|nr:ABC transporter substrate-binding protein [Aeromicrobium phragmitis]RLV57412.1 ABC transporter substrate-binding protein [Aeromicrobium phragmitis]